MAFKHMRLLKYKVGIAHGARTGTVRKAWAAAKIDEQWKENALYKSIVARSTTSRGSSCPRPRRPGITRSTRPTPPSRRPPKHRDSISNYNLPFPRYEVLLKLTLFF